MNTIRNSEYSRHLLDDEDEEETHKLIISEIEENKSNY